jgi:hypothetical protein
MRESVSEPAAIPASPGERRVRALPVLALCVLLLTAAVAIVGGGRDPRPSSRAAPPRPVADVAHYVEGSAPAVSEQFLRAWMRQQYTVAAGLAVGPLRARCELRARELAALEGAQREELERARSFTAATRYDLEHVESRDLPPDEQGRARKEVRGQAHAHGAYSGVRLDSRRGQTFVLLRIEGVWRVADRQWERLGGDRDDADAGAP